jgi:hypothetical protein
MKGFNMPQKYYNIEMEKYYEPIPKEELYQPFPGDEEIHAFCQFGIILCGAFLVGLLFAPIL